MKIAIITITNGANYGNRLQNYATQYFLEKNFDCICETLKNNSSTLVYSLRNKLKKKIISPREEIFNQFNEQYIHFSNISISNWSREKKLKDYDIFLCGSDQIWNSSFKENDKANFGYFIKTKPVISFAASFGTDEIEKNKKKKYAKYLNHLSGISVREEKGSEIVKELINKPCEVLVDPTMLLNASEWESLMKKPSVMPTKYILTYFLGNVSKERKAKIEKYAKENDCEIINLMDKNGKYYNMGPSEFLYLEKNAFLVCTDSFHSCVFAILFNTPFLIFDREDVMVNMNSRINTLLQKFHLEHHRFANQMNREELQINTKEIESILLSERKKSLKFLNHYMKGL